MRCLLLLEVFIVAVILDDEILENFVRCSGIQTRTRLVPSLLPYKPVLVAT